MATKNPILILTILVASTSFENRYAISKKERRRILEEYALQDKAFQAKLDETFLHKKSPKDAFKQAGGWTILKQDEDIVVVRNDKFPHYVVKTIPSGKNNSRNRHLNNHNLSRILQRTHIVKELQKPYMRRCGLDKKIIVPYKRVYPICGTKMHAIIADYVPIETDIKKSKKRLYSFFTPEQKKAMFRFIKNVVYWDGHEGNICPTQDGTHVAIVDSEERKKAYTGFFRKLAKYLNIRRGKKKFHKAIGG